MHTTSRAVSILHDFLRDLPEYFHRKRGSLGPRAVFSQILRLVSGKFRGYREALGLMDDAFWQEVLFAIDEFPSPGALSRARQKMSTEWFMDLFRRLLAELGSENETRLLSYLDFRLLAIDTTNVVLPSDQRLMDHFGSPTNQSDTNQAPQAGLTMLMDLGMNMPIDFTVTPCHPNERQQLAALCRSFRPGDLIIADRGYPSRATFDAIRATGADYLIRMSSHQFAVVQEFLQSGEPEAVITISGIDRKGRHEIYEPFTVRMIRDDSTEEDGKPRVFATSLLDAEQHPACDLAYLYSRRWDIEIAYRDMKTIFDGEKIHARTPLGVHQELITIMIYQALMAVLELETVKHNDLEPVEVDHVKRAAQNGDPEISVPLQDALSVTYTFNHGLLQGLVGRILGHLLCQDVELAHKRAASGIRYAWRVKRKRRPGRQFQRVPISPNAKQKNARQSAKRRKERGLK